MKINAKTVKKHARDIKHASEEELDKMQGAYKRLMGNIDNMSSPMLLVLSLAGVFLVLYFRSNFLDLIGLIVFVYPLYIFIQRESHQEGFCEGYYDLMKKEGKEAANGKKHE